MHFESIVFGVSPSWQRRRVLCWPR